MTKPILYIGLPSPSQLRAWLAAQRKERLS